MRRQIFDYTGPLKADDVRPYLVREEDHIVREQFATVGRECVLLSLIGARETGKTSLIFRVEDEFTKSGWLTVRIDLSTLSMLAGQDWYKRLVVESCWALESATQMKPKALIEHCEENFIDAFSPQGWCELLLLACQRLAPSQLLLVSLDGVNELPRAQWGPLFSNIRAIHQAARSPIPRTAAYKKLGMTLSGAFVPEQMITAENSPFNVSKLVYMSTARRDQLDTMSALLAEQGITIEDDALDAIYSWSGGALYYLKRFCAAIEHAGLSPVTVPMVDAYANDIAADDPHLKEARKHLIAEPSLRAYARAILARPLIQHRTCGEIALLEVLGAIHFDPACKRWTMTNRLFAHTLQELFVRLDAEPTRVEEITSMEVLAGAIVGRAIDFLFDQAGKIMQERREARAARKLDEDTPNSQPGAALTPKEQVQNWQPREVILKDESQQIEHLLGLIETYRNNQRLLDDTIAEYGGFKFSPLITQNQYLSTLEEIKKRTQDLKGRVEKVYGQKITIYGLE